VVSFLWEDVLSEEDFVMATFPVDLITQTAGQLAAARAVAASRSTAGNVDINASDAARVAAFWALAEKTETALNANLKRFLLHVAWHEGRQLRTRTQNGGGPGRGFFQFEPH
jgi:hypothetical protein